MGYHHTGVLEDAISTRIENKSRYESKVVVVIKPNPYPDGRTNAAQVYEWLRHGTKGGKDYVFENKDGERPTATNYPTPIHPFEEHTIIQMRGFLQRYGYERLCEKTKI